MSLNGDDDDLRLVVDWGTDDIVGVASAAAPVGPDEREWFDYITGLVDDNRQAVQDLRRAVAELSGGLHRLMIEVDDMQSNTASRRAG